MLRHILRSLNDGHGFHAKQAKRTSKQMATQSSVDHAVACKSGHSYKTQERISDDLKMHLASLVPADGGLLNQVCIEGQH